MRGVFLSALCFLAGCASGPSLEQLERQALLTGDWGAVERREQAVERRQAREGIQCPAGQTGYCESRRLIQPCRCIDSNSIYAMLGLY